MRNEEASSLGRNSVGDKVLTIFSHYCVKRASDDVFFEETLRDVLNAKPSIVYESLEECSGRTLLHNVFSSVRFPSMSLIRCLAGRSFLSVIQDHDGCVPLHYACLSVDTSITKDCENFIEFIGEISCEAVNIQNHNREYPLDVYLENRKSNGGSLNEKISDLLEIKRFPLDLSNMILSCRDMSHLESFVKRDQVLPRRITEKGGSTQYQGKTGFPFADITNKDNTRKTFPSSGKNNKAKSSDNIEKVDKQFWFEYVRAKSDEKATDDLNRMLIHQLNDQQQQLLLSKKTSFEYEEKIRKLENQLAWEIEVRKDAEEYAEGILATHDLYDQGYLDHKESNSDIEILEKVLKVKEEELISVRTCVNDLKQKLANEKLINANLSEIVNDKETEIKILQSKVDTLEKGKGFQEDDLKIDPFTQDPLQESCERLCESIKRLKYEVVENERNWGSGEGGQFSLRLFMKSLYA